MADSNERRPTRACTTTDGDLMVVTIHNGWRVSAIARHTDAIAISIRRYLSGEGR